MGMIPQHRVDPGYFDPHSPIMVAQAPARLDALGGIADYSGATVAEMPLACLAQAALQSTDDGILMVCTSGPALSTSLPPVRIPLTCLTAGDPAGAPQRLRAAVLAQNARWAAYPLGPLAILQADGLLPPLRGLRIALWSDIPLGAGVSSSAALEIATLRALHTLWQLDLPPITLAHVAQRAENQVAGAPCGIMDQVTSLLGHANHVLLLRCQRTDELPAQVAGYRALPAGVQLVGLNSGITHQVAGHQYGRVRVAAFMGRAIIQHQAPAMLPGAYLCALTPHDFYTHLEHLLPAQISGAEFARLYGDLGDDATHLEPDVAYQVRACTAHPVLEQANVALLLAGLADYEATRDPVALVEAGEAMYRSHRSYSQRCGLGSTGTDVLVEMVRSLGPQQGLYGAKITGGGGGTVAVLTAGPAAPAAIAQVAAEYQQQTGRAAQIITGSHEGAWFTPVSQAMCDEKGTLHEQ